MSGGVCWHLVPETHDACVLPRPVDDCILVLTFDSLEMNYVWLSRAVVHDTSNTRAVSVLVRVTDIHCWLNVRCCCCWFDGISATRVKACSLITRFTDTQLPASSWFFSRNLSPRSVTHRWCQCFLAFLFIDYVPWLTYVATKCHLVQIITTHVCITLLFPQLLSIKQKKFFYPYTMIIILFIYIIFFCCAFLF